MWQGKSDADPKLALLAQCEGFRTLSRDELREAARQFDEVVVPAGTVLVREGERNQSLWLIAEGFVRVTLRGKTLREHGDTELIGLPSLLDGGVAGVTATAYGAVAALVASQRQFSSLIGNPKIELALRRTSSRRVRRDFMTLLSMTGTHLQQLPASM
jgi:CRP-like cAMP-binding protein